MMTAFCIFFVAWATIASAFAVDARSRFSAREATIVWLNKLLREQTQINQALRKQMGIYAVPMPKMPAEFTKDFT